MAQEIFEEELSAVGDEVTDRVRRIEVLRGDLPDGRRTLEELGIVPD